MPDSRLRVFDEVVSAVVKSMSTAMDSKILRK